MKLVHAIVRRTANFQFGDIYRVEQISGARYIETARGEGFSVGEWISAEALDSLFEKTGNSIVVKAGEQ
jgi:hypothetical protein